MAKGKHRRRAEARLSRDSVARVDQLRAELAVERDKLEAAARRAGAVAALESELAAVTAQRDRAAAAELARLEAAEADLHEAVQETEAAGRRLQAAWERLFGRIARRFGGGLEGTEAALRTIGIPVDVAAGVYAGAELLPSAMRRLQRVRGMRSCDRAVPAPPDGLRRELPGWLLEEMVDPAIYPDDSDAATWEEAGRTVAETLASDEHDAVLRAAAGVLDRTGDWLSTVAPAVRAWHPTPWLAAGVVTPPAFGPVVGDADGARRFARTDDGVAALTDEQQVRLAARDEQVARVAHADWTPVDPPPAIPRPVDAVWLRAVYTRVAWAQAHRHRHRLPQAQPSRLSDTDADTFDTASRLLAHATPFWLPPAQAAGYAASDALDDDALYDLRLPVPRLLLTFADPLLAPASSAPTDAERALLADADRSAQTARARLRTESDAPLRALSESTRRGWFDAGLTADRIVAVRGAVVEALLLTADLDGRPGDRIVWCLAVPTADGSAVLGRVVVPASRRRCAFVAEVDNLAAAAAWGDWHRPLRDAGDAGARRPAGPLTPAEAREVAHAGADVHVLDVRTSSSATTTSEQPEGPARRMRPHLRRGHWRRQHHGPAGRLVKRIRIAPVLVNASRSDLDPTVYRLPLEAAVHTEPRSGRTFAAP